MNCAQAQDRLLDLVERTLSPADEAALLAHIEGCDRCQHARALLEQGLSFAQQLPIEPVPPAVHEAIVAAAQTTDAAAARPWWSRPQWAMAAAVALAIGLATWPRGGSDVVTEDGVVSQPASTPQPESVGQEAMATAEEERSDYDNVVAAPAPSAPVPRRARAKRKARSIPTMDERRARDEVAANKQRRATGTAAPTVAKSEGAALPAEADDGESQDALFEDMAGGRGVAADQAVSTAASTLAQAKRLQTQRRYRDAIRVYKTITAPKADVAEATLGIAQCYAALGDKKLARRWFERALEYKVTRERADKSLKLLGAR